jgi:hypothetical protein
MVVGVATLAIFALYRLGTLGVLVSDEEFTFSFNPFTPWLNGRNAEADLSFLVAFREWALNSPEEVGRDH